MIRMNRRDRRAHRKAVRRGLHVAPTCGAQADIDVGVKIREGLVHIEIAMPDGSGTSFALPPKEASVFAETVAAACEAIENGQMSSEDPQ